MKCLILLAVVSMSLPSTLGYRNGPPTSACADMLPIHESYVPLDTVSPFEILASHTCYKPGVSVTVVVRTKDLTIEEPFFEGFFVQARTDTTAAMSYGTFATISDSPYGTYLKTLDCFSKTASAISHSAAAHYEYKKFTWTPPADGSLTDDITFFGTLVRHEDEIWMGVTSPILTYNAACEEEGTEDLGTETYYGTGEGESSEEGDDLGIDDGAQGVAITFGLVWMVAVLAISRLF